VRAHLPLQINGVGVGVGVCVAVGVRVGVWGETLTLGQARQQVRNSHQGALLDWIFEQIERGVPHNEIRQALQPAMQL